MGAAFGTATIGHKERWFPASARGASHAQTSTANITAAAHDKQTRALSEVPVAHGPGQGDAGA
jgi:hypothetical protein